MKNFIETDEKYKTGILLEEYNGTHSLCVANVGKDEKVYKQWIYPQDKDRKPIAKSLPWKVTLGNTQEAIDRLKKFAEMLSNNAIQPEPNKKEDNKAPEDIPF